MNENNEELIFKGMRQLRYKRQDDMLKDALRSPYYWWWAFLRLSKDYWWVCHRRGAVGRHTPPPPQARSVGGAL